jgi:basic membrane protein A
MCTAVFSEKIQPFAGKSRSGSSVFPLKHTLEHFSMYLLLTVFCLLLICCRKEMPTSLKIPAGTFKVAIVLGGKVDDKSRTQNAYEGLLAVSEKLNIPIAYRDNVNQATENEAFRTFAREGYNFIIGFSGQFIPTLEQVARDYPHINFAVTTYYEGNNKNLGGIFFRNEEAGYIAGVIAALKSQTGRIGFIGGVPYSHLTDQLDFYKKGARSINPSIFIEEKWLNTWERHQPTADYTEAMIRQHIDVILSVADEGNFTVAKTAERMGAWVMGSVNNSLMPKPKSLLTYCRQDPSRLILESILLARKGQWEGKQYKYGFKEGAQLLMPFPGTLSKEKLDIVNKCIEQIITGEIEILKS